MEQLKEHEYHEHWAGTKNKIIRYWFYNQRGLDLFNNFRYVVMTIFGIYWALHLKNPVWLLIMFSIAIPFLTAIGYAQVHHISKVQDWLSVKFGTYYGLMQINLLKEILDELKKNNK